MSEAHRASPLVLVVGGQPSGRRARSSTLNCEGLWAETGVLSVATGPGGLTLACHLACRAAKFRILDKTPEPFKGSRGKGLRPRMLEVLDGLGLARRFLAAGAMYASMRPRLRYLGGLGR